MTRSGIVAGLLGVLLSAGCAGTLPEPIYANQMEEYFPEPPEGAPEDDVQRLVRADAERCASRLNGHRSTAEIASIFQAIISGFGGAGSGVGGVLAAIDLGDPDLTTAMGAMASVGAGITLIGNLLIGLIANPQEEMRLHAEGQRSWQVAVEMRYADGAPRAIRTSLMRCARDEAPPIRVEGSGPYF